MKTFTVANPLPTISGPCSLTNLCCVSRGQGADGVRSFLVQLIMDWSANGTFSRLFCGRAVNSQVLLLVPRKRVTASGPGRGARGSEHVRFARGALSPSRHTHTHTPQLVMLNADSTCVLSHEDWDMLSRTCPPSCGERCNTSMFDQHLESTEASVPPIWVSAECTVCRCNGAGHVFDLSVQARGGSQARDRPSNMSLTPQQCSIFRLGFCIWLARMVAAGRHAWSWFREKGDANA